MHFQIALIAIGATIAVGAVIVPIIVEEWKLVQEEMRQEREREALRQRGVAMTTARTGRVDDHHHDNDRAVSKSFGNNDSLRRRVPSSQHGRRGVSEEDPFVLDTETDAAISPVTASAPSRQPLISLSSHLDPGRHSAAAPTWSRSSSAMSGATVPLFSPAPSIVSSDTVKAESDGWEFMRADDDGPAAAASARARKSTSSSPGSSEHGWEHVSDSSLPAAA